ncbi:hypothetical protein TW95_gp1635 [Pandoravirus inopinatum]|uniref:Uncharacterized protein n=1 Tax=Pandoravirus inopinatum TaxID=1605721 RepID=A0A0B5J425_9VIRU|nr:hypothetical protein TW95_gp1635 [Pandoravirus inopinatum]AJF98369.1 hypothetical protein [Pandoravirus inopinatum]
MGQIFCVEGKKVFWFLIISCIALWRLAKGFEGCGQCRSAIRGAILDMHQTGKTTRPLLGVIGRRLVVFVVSKRGRSCRGRTAQATGVSRPTCSDFVFKPFFLFS